MTINFFSNQCFAIKLIIFLWHHFFSIPLYDWKIKYQSCFSSISWGNVIFFFKNTISPYGCKLNIAANLPIKKTNVAANLTWIWFTNHIFTDKQSQIYQNTTTKSYRYIPIEPSNLHLLMPRVIFYNKYLLLTIICYIFLCPFAFVIVNVSDTIPSHY